MIGFDLQSSDTQVLQSTAVQNCDTGAYRTQTVVTNKLENTCYLTATTVKQKDHQYEHFDLG